MKIMDSDGHGTYQVMGKDPTRPRRKKLETLRESGVTSMSLSDKDKQELVLASFRQEVSVADLCRRVQVPESTFRDWRDRFIAAGTAALQPAKPTKEDADKAALIKENARLKTVVADLSVENLVLKKGRNGALSLASI
jgi:transposase